MIDDPGRIGLDFFGTVAASISHELNNRLAVINEQAGLVQDYIHLGRQGRELDLERLEAVSNTVQREVAKANMIIKNLNQFAHSVDEPKQDLDLKIVLNLAAALSSRSADMHEVSLKVQAQDEPLMTNAFFFGMLNLIWVCIALGVRAAAPKTEVTAILGIVSGKIVLSVRTVPDAGKHFDEDLISAGSSLAAEMALSFIPDRATGHIDVRLA